MELEKSLEEAKKIAEDNKLTIENLKSNKDCYYRTKVIEALEWLKYFNDNPTFTSTKLPEMYFIRRVEKFVEYMEISKKLNDELYNWLRTNKLSNSLRAEFDLDSYLNAGMVPMKDLEEGYYLGKCRNTTVAFWNPSRNEFQHTRTKWGHRYVENIPHLEEPNYSFDLFIPIRKMDINEVDKNNIIELWK